MAVFRLTDSLLNKLTCPPGQKRLEACDSEVRGLYCLVSETNIKTYFWRTKVNGKTTHIKVGRTTEISLTDAREKVKILKSEQSSPADNSSDSIAAKSKGEMTLSEFWETYYLPLAKQKKRSWKRDVQLFVRIASRFGSHKLCEIERHEIQLFHGNLLKDNLSPASCDLHAALLKRMLSMCVEYSLLDKNPAAKMKLFHADNRVEHYLDEAQLAKLLEVLRTDRCRAVCQICLFLLATGCRLNEALSAKWSQVDRANRTFKVLASNSKSKRMRIVPLNDSAMEVVDELDSEGRYEYLFVNEKTGKPFVNFTRVWYKLRKKAGVPHLRLHDLRHGAASNLINSGASLYIVQQILGHSNPIVTQRYAHLSMQSLHDASANASAIISRAKQSVAKLTTEAAGN